MGCRWRGLASPAWTFRRAVTATSWSPCFRRDRRAGRPAGRGVPADRPRPGRGAAGDRPAGPPWPGAGRYTITADAESRGEIASSQAGTTAQWIAERCPALDGRDAGLVAKAVRELARPQLRTTADAVAAGRLSVPAGCVVAAEWRQLEPLDRTGRGGGGAGRAGRDGRCGRVGGGAPAAAGGAGPVRAGGGVAGGRGPARRPPMTPTHHPNDRPPGTAGGTIRRWFRIAPVKCCLVRGPLLFYGAAARRAQLRA